MNSFKYIFTKKYILLIFLILLVYITTAYYSSGYHFADEHYQIIEFANYKLGNINKNQLAWEFEAQVRSSIQPWISVILIKTMDNMGLSNPYTQMFIFRLLSAFLSIVSLFYLFVGLLKRKIIDEKYKNYFIYLLFFFWFIPYISVRFSSESWSTAFFIFGISIYLISNKLSFFKLLYIGFLFGLAFLFRFQTGVLIFSFFLWVFFIEKIKLLKTLNILTGVLISIIIGVYLDYLFYDSISFCWLNYFRFNILEGQSAQFGTSPWWMFIKYFYKYPTYPIGFIIVTSLAYYIIRYRKSLITFLVVTFILIHLFIPHKELRFLFPIAYIAPIIVFVFLSDVFNFLKNRSKYFKYIILIYLAILFIINSIALIAFGTKSADNGRMAINEYIYNNYKGKVNIIAEKWYNSYNPFGLPMTYYITKNLKFVVLDNDESVNDKMISDNFPNLLIVSKRYYDKNKGFLNQKHFFLVKKGVSDWILYLTKYQKGLDPNNVTYLLKFKEL